MRKIIGDAKRSMKKSELKTLIENQRKIIVALEYYFMVAGYLPSKDEPLQYHLHNLWEITDLIDKSFNLDLISLPEIIKEVQFQTGVNDMNKMNTTKFIN